MELLRNFYLHYVLELFSSNQKLSLCITNLVFLEIEEYKCNTLGLLYPVRAIMFSTFVLYTSPIGSKEKYSSMRSIFLWWPELRGRESHPACEIMLTVISNYLECRTISSPRCCIGGLACSLYGSPPADGLPRYCPQHYLVGFHRYSQVLSINCFIDGPFEPRVQLYTTPHVDIYYYTAALKCLDNSLRAIIAS